MRFKLIRKNFSDKEFDKRNYDRIAELQAGLSEKELQANIATTGIQEYQKIIFDYYYECIRVNIHSKMDVLELGAGMGRHTGAILNTGANLTVNDISASSLKILKRIFPNVEHMAISSMENIPAKSKSYDAIISCGSLSYADPDKLDNEIYRLLRENGILIVLDTLNHNPIYKLNRYFKYLTNKRSKLSITRIPDFERIARLSQHFNKFEIKFFGTYYWIIQILKYFIGESLAQKTNLLLEKNFPSKKNAFKFVLVCSGYHKFQERKY
jgi:ubiquinone/menaquinone biosynthesis C-methylase UbiE